MVWLIITVIVLGAIFGALAHAAGAWKLGHEDGSSFLPTIILEDRPSPRDWLNNSNSQEQKKNQINVANKASA